MNHKLSYTHPETGKPTFKFISDQQKEALEEMLYTKGGSAFMRIGDHTVRKSSISGIFPVKEGKDEFPPDYNTATRYDLDPPTKEQWKKIVIGAEIKYPYVVNFSPKFAIGLCKNIWNLGKEDEFIKLAESCEGMPRTPLSEL